MKWLANGLTLVALSAPLVASCGSDGSVGAPAASHPSDVGRVGDGTLNDQLDAIRGYHRLPALAAVVFGPDGVLESGVSGVRALGYPELAAAEDQWHIGSLTKSMTATLAAMLIEQHRLGWQSTIAEVFPEVPMRAEYSAVTLTDLLTNSAGMASDATRAPSWGSLSTSTQSLRDQRRRLTAEYLAMAPSSARGTFNYSNAGYIVAGAMLEQVMDETWEDLMSRLVFAPLGMSSAGFGPPAGSGPRDEPWGHAIVGDGLRPIAPGPGADNPPALGPAGTVHSGLADLSAYYVMHLRGAMALPTSLLSEASFQTLHQPISGASYACGWEIAERAWGGEWSCSTVAATPSGIQISGSLPCVASGCWWSPTRAALAPVPARMMRSSC